MRVTSTISQIQHAQTISALYARIKRGVKVFPTGHFKTCGLSHQEGVEGIEFYIKEEMFALMIEEGRFYESDEAISIETMTCDKMYIQAEDREIELSQEEKDTLYQLLIDNAQIIF